MSEEQNHQNLNPAAVVADPVAAAHELTPLIRAHADETERGRRLAAPVVSALRAAGLFAMGLPVSLGGIETPLATALRAIEQVAYADGASGWNVMIALDSGMWAGFLRAAEARALIASLPQPIIAGSVNPPGRIQRSAGGYRLSGRWRFLSGCQQADVFFVAALLYDGDQPVVGINGIPVMPQITLSAADITILDTWHVAGLRGTGSHDIAVENRFVADGLVQPLSFDGSVEPGALYGVPLVGVFAVAKAAVAFGIARHAIEALKDLALAKTPTGQSNLLRERPAIQAGLARAEASVRSARAFLNEVVSEAWDTVVTGNPITTEQRAWLRLAAVDGVQRAIHAVDLMYEAGGGSAIYETSPLERCFRDVHAVPAHIVVQPAVYEFAGRVLFGLPPGTPLW